MTAVKAPFTLYEVADEYAKVVDALTDGDGVENAELEAQLDAIASAFQVKVERVGLYTQNLKRSAEAAKAESDRLDALCKSRLRAAAWLTEYLKRNMEKVNETKIVTPLITARIQKNSRPSIGLPEGTEIPAAYQRVTVSLDGQKAYDDWKAKTLPGVFVVEHGSHLRLQ